MATRCRSVRRFRGLAVQSIARRPGAEDVAGPGAHRLLCDAAMPAPSSPSPELRVAVLARDPETLDGLTDYLRAAGAHAVPKRDLVLKEHAEVIVLFGDDFDRAASAQFVREWVRTPAPVRPDLGDQ